MAYLRLFWTNSKFAKLSGFNNPLCPPDSVESGGHFFVQIFCPSGFGLAGSFFWPEFSGWKIETSYMNGVGLAGAAELPLGEGYFLAGVVL